MDPKRIAQYAKMMRKEGIKSLTIGDVAIQLDPDYQPKALKAKNQPETSSTIADPITEQFNEEDLLLWSSGVTGPV